MHQFGASNDRAISSSGQRGGTGIMNIRQALIVRDDDDDDYNDDYIYE